MQAPHDRTPAFDQHVADLLSLPELHSSRERAHHFDLSEYDHLMLHLHDALKRDEAYPASAPQADVEFLPGQTWVTFSDLVMHGAMGGRYMLEQTAFLPVSAQADPALSPQRILARKLGRDLH